MRFAGEAERFGQVELCVETEFCVHNGALKPLGLLAPVDLRFCLGGRLIAGPVRPHDIWARPDVISNEPSDAAILEAPAIPLPCPASGFRVMPAFIASPMA